MTPEIFAEWFRLQGMRVVRTSSSYWVENATGVYQAFPYHWVICPSDAELIQFLRGNRAMGLRYSTTWDAPYGMASYHVMTGRGYALENLSRWARKNILRGLRNCRVEQISFDYLAEAGWDLQVDTLARQRRRSKMERLQWQTLCQSASDLPGFEAWGAFVAGRLSASIITFLMNDCAYMLYQQCLREFLRQHVNNALGYVVTKALVERPEIKSILYGLQSLDAPPSVDEFKFRMGYIAKPVRQRVVFHPLARALVNPASHTVLKSVCRLRPGAPTLSKAEGMLRFFLQGQRPLDEQNRPLFVSAINAER